MNRNEAFREAVKILKDEANSLALIRTEQPSVTALPHRAKVAIQREIDRLREIAEHIEGAMIEGAFNEENDLHHPAGGDAESNKTRPSGLGA